MREKLCMCYKRITPKSPEHGLVGKESNVEKEERNTSHQRLNQERGHVYILNQASEDGSGSEGTR